MSDTCSVEYGTGYPLYSIGCDVECRVCQKMLLNFSNRPTMLEGVV